MTSFTPVVSQRVRITSIVCGKQESATKKVSLFALLLTQRCTASAAAVPSSSIDAFATGRPVNPAIIVWKFMSISSRP